MNQETKSRLAAISVRWNKIEARMKNVEFFRGEVVIAAINELRYAGRRVADALLIVSSDAYKDGAQDVKIGEHLLLADSYLTNADHDLTDAVVLFVTIRLKRTIAAHGITKLRSEIPDFDKFLDIAEEARALVISSRFERPKRVDIYTRLRNEFEPELIRLQAMVDSRPALFVADTQEKRGLQLLSIVAFIAAVMTIGNVIFNVVVWYHRPAPLTLDQIQRVITKPIER